MVDIPSEWLWIVILGFIIAFALAFGIGANDVANSFGTSVGSKVLTLTKACILATIFEILGAVLIGYRVSDTIRKGIVDVAPYNNSEKLLLMGNLSALSGSCIWLFLATLLRLPVSGTHSVVGATVGFSLVAQGAKGVGWGKLGLIAASWFISPVTSGIISAALFWLIRTVVLNKEKPLEPGLKLLPVFYAATIFINAFSVFLDGSELLSFDKIPIYGTFIIAIGLASITALLVRILVVPWMRRKVQEDVKNAIENGDWMKEKEEKADKVGDEKLSIKSFANLELDSSNANEMTSFVDDDRENDTKLILPNNGSVKQKDDNGPPSPVKYGSTVERDASDIIDPESALVCSIGTKDCEKSSDESSEDGSKDGETKRIEQRQTIKDQPETARFFSFLQILTAIFGSFAHGGNDVSNAIGPLVAIWVISTENSVSQQAPTPLWILLYGGVGISVGLWILGRRVIQTMGEDLSKITPSSGFCIELGAAFTVLVASNLKIPISTTHCKVGSIVFVGRLRSNDNVDWSLFRNILIAWVVTLPVSGALSALMMFFLKEYAL